MLQVGWESLVCTETPEALAAMRRSFETSHAVHLPRFFDAGLLEWVQHGVCRAQFAEREDDGLAVERCMESNTTLAMLLLVLNDSSLFDVVRRITGCRAIGSFTGRIYMMEAVKHYDGWHSDVDGARLVGMSVNLTDGDFAGGRFELRRAGNSELAWCITNSGPGDAILFEISDCLQHRVTNIAGDVPRVACAGWFQSHPQFLDVLKRGAQCVGSHEVY